MTALGFYKKVQFGIVICCLEDSWLGDWGFLQAG